MISELSFAASSSTRDCAFQNDFLGSLDLANGLAAMTSSTGALLSLLDSFSAISLAFYLSFFFFLLSRFLALLSSFEMRSVSS